MLFLLLNTPLNPSNSTGLERGVFCLLIDKGETLVFKRPTPRACKQCVKHYLEEDGVVPKVFKLSEILANGDNYKKKMVDWKPVWGTMHPNCHCTRHIIPNDMMFDKEGDMIPKK